MKISENGKRLLAEWEGINTRLYRDSGNALTIGIGHLLTRDELTSGKIWINSKPVKYRDGLTDQQCWDLLDQDLKPAESAINNNLVIADLNQNQFDALVSFVFNVGVTAFLRSTLLKQLNQGQFDQVPAQLRRWVHASGKVVKGLINRREKEIVLWNQPSRALQVASQ